MIERDTYNCHGFHEDLPNRKASGRLTVSDTCLEVSIQSKQLRIPLQDLSLQQGGASERLIFFRHPEFDDWRIYTSDRTILKNPLFDNYPHLAAATRKARSQRRRGWLILATVACLALAIPLTLLFRMDWVSHKIAQQVPEQWEQKLGESSLAQYQLGTPIMDEEKAGELLEPLTAPLVAALSESKYDYHFYISEDASANAFALPGGYVVIHSGLILRADNAEELLGVLAHEISHVTEQHGLRNVIGAAGIYVVVTALLGDSSGLLATLAGAAPFLLNQQYSRKFERQADEKGHELLLSAKVDPSGLARFFEKLIEEEQQALEEIEDEDTRELVKNTLDFLSSHPASEKRIAYLRALPVPEMTFRNLQQPFEVLKAEVKTFSTRDN